MFNILLQGILNVAALSVSIGYTNKATELVSAAKKKKEKSSTKLNSKK